MKCRLVILSLATLFCCSQANAKSTLLSKLSEKEPWEFMDYHLHEGPSQKVKSSIERKLNIAAPVGLITTALISLCLGVYYEDELLELERAERAYSIAAITALLGGLTGLWGILRNCWLLVWKAEKEIFNELLDNWTKTSKVLPPELVETFENALIMRSRDPEQFKRELPLLIAGLQKETNIHTFARHYYSLRHSIYRLIHALRDRTAAQAQAAEKISTIQHTDTTASVA